VPCFSAKKLGGDLLHESTVEDQAAYLQAARGKVPWLRRLDESSLKKRGLELWNDEYLDVPFEGAGSKVRLTVGYHL